MYRSIPRQQGALRAAGNDAACSATARNGRLLYSIVRIETTSWRATLLASANVSLLVHDLPMRVHVSLCLLAYPALVGGLACQLVTSVRAALCTQSLYAQRSATKTFPLREARRKSNHGDTKDLNKAHTIVYTRTRCRDLPESDFRGKVIGAGVQRENAQNQNVAHTVIRSEPSWTCTSVTTRTNRVEC